jgi:hypothetical protein
MFTALEKGYFELARAMHIPEKDLYKNQLNQEEINVLF